MHPLRAPLLPLWLTATLLAAPASAEPSTDAPTATLGLAWRPLSRADLMWTADGRTSGVAVGEFDGVVAPDLRPFAGVWLAGRWGLLGGLGFARLDATTWTGDTFRQRVWAVLRPELEARWTFWDRRDTRPTPFLLLAGYGDVPFARDTSNTFTEEEQDAADENATLERARLGGFGLRAGLGVDHELVDHLRVGFVTAFRWHQGVLRTSEATTTSSWMAVDAAITVAFEWPPTPDAPLAESPATGE